MILTNFLSGRRSPTAPRGHRVYAIGDVHGRLDLLEQMLDQIAQDDRARSRAKTTIIFLGDLIDRGPHSAQVVELLRDYRPTFAKAIFLMGNHEEIFLRILEGEMSLLREWLSFGGAECLKSYNLDPTMVKRCSPAEVEKILKDAVPNEHQTFLKSFVDTASFGPYLFVHAGIRPGVPLANQDIQDLRWIRNPFLHDERDHGHIVVHGHSIQERIDLRPNRIGLDTGAYRTGILSALGIEGDQRWFLQTKGDTPKRDLPASVANVSVAY